jgi:hypothetical protein
MLQLDRQYGIIMCRFVKSRIRDNFSVASLRSLAYNANGPAMSWAVLPLGGVAERFIAADL